MRLRNLEDLCEQIATGVEGALGCAFVDLQTGLPLTLKVRAGGLFDANAMDVLSVAGVAYFADDGMGGGDAGDASQRDVVDEIQITTEDAYCFMSRLPGDAGELLILVIDRKASNLGLGWMSMRQALREVESIDAADAGDAADEGAAAARDAARTADDVRRAAPNPRPAPGNDSILPVRSRQRRSIWS